MCKNTEEHGCSCENINECSCYEYFCGNIKVSQYGIQDVVNYGVHLPKNMDKMDYEELVKIFSENMEALAALVRYEIFKNYDGELPEIFIID